ncbi:MAG: hypothetical protein HF975_04210 [ANME-2 cluster archaeon]|nr:hypothetical protein [ANME-2 cluster archaeon]
MPEPRPVEIKEAVKLYIEDIPLTERNTIGKCIIEMRSMSERIQQFLFEFDEDGDAISERIEGASEFIEIFRMWIKGEDIEYIAEAIAQTDITIISGVLDIFGIE